MCRLAAEHISLLVSKGVSICAGLDRLLNMQPLRGKHRDQSLPYLRRPEAIVIIFSSIQESTNGRARQSY
jgi:hypothetical protein